MRTSLFTQLAAAVRIVVLMTVVLGVAYPLAMTAVAQTAFGHQADGALVRVDGEVVGSSLIGQAFTSPAYFQPRPSAVEFDGAGSGGSNLGPTDQRLLDDVAARVDAYRAANDLSDDVVIPVDAVTSSGSGLDPHISPENAAMQSTRVAAARGIDPLTVVDLVDDHTQRRTFGVLGDDAVNVLELNIALDEVTGRP